jgi:NTP pyrophosphatase (non-canonical NTP hydrolase)
MPYAKSTLDLFRLSLNTASEQIHSAQVKAGWYKNPVTGRKIDRNVMEMLMLVTTEIAEAAEGYRKSLPDDKLPHRQMIEVELADTLIRIFDLAGYLDLDLGGAVVEKLLFNLTREDHTLAARAAEGGKKC